MCCRLCCFPFLLLHIFLLCSFLSFEPPPSMWNAHKGDLRWLLLFLCLPSRVKTEAFWQPHLIYIICEVHGRIQSSVLSLAPKNILRIQGLLLKFTFLKLPIAIPYSPTCLFAPVLWALLFVLADVIREAPGYSPGIIVCGFYTKY